MDVELAEIRDFLAAHAPFSGLPAETLQGLPRRLGVRYFRRGTTILEPGASPSAMYVLRSGAVDIADADGQLVERADVGTCFAQSALIDNRPSRYRITAVEDSLVLDVPPEVFEELLREHAAFALYFLQQQNARLHDAVARVTVAERGSAVLGVPARRLLRRAPVTIAPTGTIRAAAQTMAREGLSCLLVTEADRLVGILTDRDLRGRVVALGRDLADPVSEVMTPDPVCADASALAFELLLTMLELGVNHLPVLEEGRLTGLVSSTDVMRLQRTDPMLVVADLARAGDAADLAVVTAQVPSLVTQLVTQDASAKDIGRILSGITDALHRRLLRLAEKELGPAPLAYCWAVFGSQARREQGLGSDQDHGLILAAEPDEAAAAWFAALAERVSAGLEACGYRRCPGEVMATNPARRVALSRWRTSFAEWIERPDPQGVLGGSIFFDLRAVAGEHRLAEELMESVLEQAGDRPRFLAQLAAQAVRHQPPLGFFRGFVLEKGGEHRNTLDLKHGGVNAVVEMVRALALGERVRASGTHDRLDALLAAERLTPERVADVHDAFEFVSYVRLRHQARAVEAGRPPDDFVAPDRLSGFERRHLRDAFNVVRGLRPLLAQRYPLHYTS